MNDQDYLASAGIDAETGNAVSAANDTASTPNTASTPAGEAAGAEASTQTPEQKAVEMFELMGQKFPVNTEFKFNHGKEILKVPYDKLTNTYRQWHHLQNKWANEYKPKIDEFEKLRPEFDRYKGFYDKYGAIQEWSEKNPDQWQALWEMYQNRDKHLLQHQTLAGNTAQQAQELGLNPQALQPILNPLLEQITALKQQVQDLSGFKQSLETQEQARIEQQDVETVKKEIFDFQKKYPEVNLDERDPDGVALWAKIVSWGLNEGYRDFEPAARVFLKDRIEDVVASRARAEALKGLKTDKQNGVVKRSTTPITGQGNAASGKDIRNMSYSEIAQLSKQMLSQSA